MNLIKKYFLYFFSSAYNYCQKRKEKLRKKARERYQNISEEEKDNKRKKTQERYQSFTEKIKRKNVSVLPGMQAEAT